MRRVYRELLRAGRSRQDVITEVIKVAVADAGEPDGAADGQTSEYPAGHRNEHEPEIADAGGADAAVPSALPLAAGAAIPTTDRAAGVGSWILRLAPPVAILTAAGIAGLLVLPATSPVDSEIAVGPAKLASNVAQPGPQVPLKTAETTAEATASAPSPAVAPASPPDRSKSDKPLVAPSAVPTVDATTEPALTQHPPPVPAVAAPSNARPPSAANSAPTELTLALLERGDTLFGMGDLASARLFYQRAAEAGDGQGALRLGESYDPAFLVRAPVIGARGDASLAVYWYERARELGLADAEVLLRSVLSGNR